VSYDETITREAGGRERHRHTNALDQFTWTTECRLWRGTAFQDDDRIDYVEARMGSTARGAARTRTAMMLCEGHSEP
jgi:hypothetical protein